MKLKDTMQEAYQTIIDGRDAMINDLFSLIDDQKKRLEKQERQIEMLENSLDRNISSKYVDSLYRKRNREPVKDIYRAKNKDVEVFTSASSDEEARYIFKVFYGLSSEDISDTILNVSDEVNV